MLNRRACLATGLAAVAAPAFAATRAPIDASAYPRLDREQLGHLEFIASIADQLGGDWSRMGHSEPGQGGFDAYRYQLAMMSYTLNLANYHYTPAYRELHQETTRKLIDKMMRYDVWGFWEATSRGAKAFNPALKELTAGWIDPVKDQNIMFSGHLFQMINSYAMLYGDQRYEQPGALTFVYNPVGQGMGRQEFVYDNTALAKVLYSQFEENGWAGIECEPNAIFPECNQHPILAYVLYDKRYGTDYFPTVSSRFRKVFNARDYVDPKTGSFMVALLREQDVVVQHPLPWSDGWSGTFMHPWAKDYVETLYPAQRERWVAKLPDGSATVRMDQPRDSYSHDHGFFGVLAAEVGDIETRDRFLAYADRYWSPRWDGDALNYPRSDGFVRAGEAPGKNGDVWTNVHVLTGNALMGLSRINRADGFHAMINRPWGKAHFEQPYVSDVARESLLVSRAVYDPEKGALVVSLTPRSGAKTDAAGWTARNLDPAARYGVWRDGHRVAGVPAGQTSVRVAAPIRKETSFVVLREA
jgi:hypothetical protein